MHPSSHLNMAKVKTGHMEILQNYALATGVGIFGGSFAGFLAENLLQAKAIGSSPWSALVTFATSFFMAHILFKHKNFFCGLSAPFLIFLSVVTATNLRDSSPDGLGFHAEKIKKEIENEVFKKTEKQAQQPNSASLSLMSRNVHQSLYYSSIFAKCTGNVESGKWLNIAWPIAGSLLMLAGFTNQITTSFRGIALFVLVLFQPVIIYQLGTLYQDSQLAGALTGFFGSILLLFAKINVVYFLACLLCLICLATSKTFAFGYVIIFCFILLSYVISKKFKITCLPWAGMLLGIAVLVSLSSSFLYSIRHKDYMEEQKLLGNSLPKILFFINPVVLDPKQTDGIHVGCGAPSHNAAVLFWQRHFAATKRTDPKPQIKPPFWFTRPELDVFADLTPDLRLGGYGPLYGTAVLLALIPGFLLLFSRAPSQAGWQYILVACLVMVPITPSWWARWFPQGWWIPLAACVGFFSGPADWLKKFYWSRWLAKGGLMALFLNSFLILVFTVEGYVEAESIIRRQVSFLSTCPPPLHVETGHFTATRFWLDQKKIAYVYDEIPNSAAFMVLYRTTLKIRLTIEDLERIRQSPSFLELLRKHKLLNLPGA